MSSDEFRWCKNANDKINARKCISKDDDDDDTSCWKDAGDASYTFLNVYHIDKNDDDDDKYDDQISVINIHKHRKRDSRNNSNYYYDNNSTNSAAAAVTSTCHHHQQQRQRHTSMCCRNYQIVNLCFIIMLYVICNIFVTSVNCDELMDKTGARGHYTHTWAVHIPGGETVARLVADDHGMIFRGKVSVYSFFIFATIKYLHMWIDFC